MGQFYAALFNGDPKKNGREVGECPRQLIYFSPPEVYKVGKVIVPIICDDESIEVWKDETSDPEAKPKIFVHNVNEIKFPIQESCLVTHLGILNLDHDGNVVTGKKLTHSFSLSKGDTVTVPLYTIELELEVVEPPSFQGGEDERTN